MLVPCAPSGPAALSTSQAREGCAGVAAGLTSTPGRGCRPAARKYGGRRLRQGGRRRGIRQGCCGVPWWCLVGAPRPSLKLPYSPAKAAKVRFPATWTGTAEPVVELFPSWPKKPSPPACHGERRGSGLVHPGWSPLACGSHGAQQRWCRPWIPFRPAAQATHSTRPRAPASGHRRAPGPEQWPQRRGPPPLQLAHWSCCCCRCPGVPSRRFPACMREAGAAASSAGVRRCSEPRGEPIQPGQQSSLGRPVKLCRHRRRGGGNSGTPSRTPCCRRCRT